MSNRVANIGIALGLVFLLNAKEASATTRPTSTPKDTITKILNDLNVDTKQDIPQNFAHNDNNILKESPSNGRGNRGSVIEKSADGSYALTLTRNTHKLLEIKGLSTLKDARKAAKKWDKKEEINFENILKSLLPLKSSIKLKSWDGSSVEYSHKNNMSGTSATQSYSTRYMSSEQIIMQDKALNYLRLTADLNQEALSKILDQAFKNASQTKIENKLSDYDIKSLISAYSKIHEIEVENKLNGTAANYGYGHITTITKEASTAISAFISEKEALDHCLRHCNLSASNNTKPSITPFSNSLIVPIFTLEN